MFACSSAADLTVGYVILAAPNEGSAVFELLSQLYHAQDTFAIHIDSKDPTKAVKLTKKLKKKYPRGNLVVRNVIKLSVAKLTAAAGVVDAIDHMGRVLDAARRVGCSNSPTQARPQV